MTNLSFLSALAFSRTALRDLLGEIDNASTPIGALVEAERDTSMVHVAAALRAGDALSAAHSPKASPAFRDGMRAVLSPAMQPLVTVLAETWAPVLAGQEELRVRVGGDCLRHLPECVQDANFLPAGETRAVCLALLDDPVMLGMWAQAQTSRDPSTPEGLLRYAVGNSAFMDALKLFGRRFNTAGPGEPARYVFALDRAQELYTEHDGELLCLLDLQPSVPTEGEDGTDVETQLQHLCGQWPALSAQERAAFSDLYAQVLDVACTRPGTLARIRAGAAPLLSGKQHRALALRRGLSAAALTRVVEVFQHALVRLEDCR